MAMFGYMTDLDTVDPKRNRSYEVSGKTAIYQLLHYLFF
jgi:SHS2 domain-containing protein